MLRDLFSLFPAYAGVIPAGFTTVAALIAFPRIRGGDPSRSQAVTDVKIFSPHTRG